MTKTALITGMKHVVAYHCNDEFNLCSSKTKALLCLNEEFSGDGQIVRQQIGLIK